jgi:hypothetical protein
MDMWTKDASLRSNSDEDVLMELLATDFNGYSLLMVLGVALILVGSMGILLLVHAAQQCLLLAGKRC